MSAEPLARDRILESAYELFSTRGVRAVGIEEVIERAAVAKATLYRHFPSKDELVLAFLKQREVVWTHGWVEAEARKRGATPEECLLAIFDLFDEWFHRPDFEGCSFVNILLETAESQASGGPCERRPPREHPLRPPLPRRRGRSALERRVRALVPHPDEGLDRPGRRGRRRRCEARAGNGARPDREIPLDPPKKGLRPRFASPMLRSKTTGGVAVRIKLSDAGHVERLLGLSRVRHQCDRHPDRPRRGRGVVSRLAERECAGDAVGAPAPDVARGASRRDCGDAGVLARTASRAYLSVGEGVF